jgi:hypothetical protein
MHQWHPRQGMQKKTPQVHRNTGTPCAMVLRLIRALLGVPGLLATVAPAKRLAMRLTSASGGRDHTISLVRLGRPSSLASQHVHRIPHHAS